MPDGRNGGNGGRWILPAILSVMGALIIFALGLTIRVSAIAAPRADITAIDARLRTQEQTTGRIDERLNALLVGQAEIKDRLRRLEFRSDFASERKVEP